MSHARFSLPLLALWAASACGTPAPEATQPRVPPMSVFSAASAPSAEPAVPQDALGPRPGTPLSAVFAPNAPVVFEHSTGLRVWLLERHTLPVVAMQFVVPFGSASDPSGKEGTAYITAGMLDEGAGRYGALELSQAVDLLGAELHTQAFTDYSTVSLFTLKKNAQPAAALLGDVVTKPRFLPVEYKRVKDLWLGDLGNKAKDAVSVAARAELRLLFGAEHAYGHPVDGTKESATKVQLADVTSFYKQHYRPDIASVVIVGDVTRKEAENLLDTAFGGFRAPPTPAPTPLTPPRVAYGTRRVVLIDKPAAPQSVISLVVPGVAASDADAAVLSRVNAAIGGSFTSRLNQHLREDKGWTYGAKSRFSFSRSAGLFSAGASVVADKTADALKVLEEDVRTYAAQGPTAEEVDKTRLLSRADLVEVFESASGAASRLARNAGVGLSPDTEGVNAKRRDEANGAELARLAQAYLKAPPLFVVVGPRSSVEPQLRAAGYTDLIVESSSSPPSKGGRP